MPRKKTPKAKKLKCVLCGAIVKPNHTTLHLEKEHPETVREIRESASKKFWHDVCKSAGCPPPPDYLFKKRPKNSRRRFRPEKIVSVREFLTGEHRTNADLPRNLEIANSNGKNSRPIRQSSAQRYFGSGKRPRWLDDTPKKR